MSKQNTRATIDANIKQNGLQQIKGQTLNTVLNTMVTDYAEQEKLTDLERKVSGELVVVVESRLFTTGQNVYYTTLVKGGNLVAIRLKDNTQGKKFYVISNKSNVYTTLGEITDDSWHTFEYPAGANSLNVQNVSGTDVTTGIEIAYSGVYYDIEGLKESDKKQTESIAQLAKKSATIDELERDVYGSDIDYSEYNITHYFFDSALKVWTSARYDMTDYIPVKEGNSIIMRAMGDPNIPMVVGYSDNAGNGAVALLTNISEASDEVVAIPNGVNFVRCCGRNTTYPGVTKNMVVTLKISDTYTKGLTQEVEALKEKAERIGDTIVVPKNKKILLVGASFATSINGWASVLAQSLGCEIVNKAVGSTNIINNVAYGMLDADASHPHGTLFDVNGTDIFQDVAAMIIFHVHNQDVLLSDELYKSRDAEYYRANGVTWGNYAEGFDYVIKQYREWCNAVNSVTETIQGVTRSTIFGTHPCQILLVSHWLPSRKIYNISSRSLAKRFNLPYCALDENIGITGKDKVHCITNTDAQATPTEGDYNPSVLMAQYVGVSDGKPIGKTEIIDGVTWGHHPLLMSPTINYGYGSITTSDGTFYVPYIQAAISKIMEKCIKVIDL